MEEIYKQNFKRNSELIKEVNKISNLFITNNIDHVFLKGAALVSSIYKQSLGIRMVGDIDILINNDQILKARSILENHGYKPIFQFFPNMNKKHLDRMISKKNFFAVELHYRISNKIKFDCNKFINSKKNLNNIFILNENDLLFHTIINYQLNDYGSLRAGFNFRTLFDIVNILNIKPALIKKVPNSLHVKKIQVVLKNLNLINYKTPLNLLLFETRFKLINKFYFFSFINDFLFDIFKFITVSPVIRKKQIIALFLRKDFRMYVLKKLRIIN